MPKQKEKEQPKLKEFVEDQLSVTAQDKLRQELAFTNYQFTWYLDRPRRWPVDKVAVFAKSFSLSWEYCVAEFELGADQLSPLLSAPQQG